MLCIVVKGPSPEQVLAQMAQALPLGDIVELRLDLFDRRDEAFLSELRQRYSIPMIFTLRSSLQGGDYPFSETERLREIRRLAQLKPEYLDLEDHISPDDFETITAEHPEIKCIVSHHDFTKTSEDLDGLYNAMLGLPAAIYKIAVTADNTLDAMRFLCWAKEKRGDCHQHGPIWPDQPHSGTNCRKSFELCLPQ